MIPLSIFLVLAAAALAAPHLPEAVGLVAVGLRPMAAALFIHAAARAGGVCGCAVSRPYALAVAGSLAALANPSGTFVAGPWNLPLFRPQGAGEFALLVTWVLTAWGVVAALTVRPLRRDLLAALPLLLLVAAMGALGLMN